VNHFDYETLMRKVGVVLKGVDHPSGFDIPSRSSLYFDVQMLSQAIPCEIPIGGESKGVMVFMASKAHLAEMKLIEPVNDLLEVFVKERLIPIRTIIVDDVLMSVCPWSMRYQVRSTMIEFMETQSFQKAIWPVMAPDFAQDERQLKSLFSQTKSSFLASIASQFSPTERAWAFSHFNLTQRRGERGYCWVVDVGTDLHLIDAIEKLWEFQRAKGELRRIELYNGINGTAAEGAPTWISETIEFRSKDFSSEVLADFCNYLRLLVNSIYLGTVEVPVDEEDEADMFLSSSST
jgi:hypothetical protein